MNVNLKYYAWGDLKKKLRISMLQKKIKRKEGKSFLKEAKMHKLKSLDTFKRAVRKHGSLWGKSNNLEYISTMICNLLLCVWVVQSCPTFCNLPVAHQAPLSMGFYRQEYWSGLPFPPPEDLSDTGIEPGLLHCRQILHRLSYREVAFYYCSSP